MNSYIFGSFDFRHSILLKVLCSLFAIFLFASQFSLVVAGEEFLESEFQDIQKRDDGKDGANTAGVTPAPSAITNSNPSVQQATPTGVAPSAMSSTEKSAVAINNSFEDSGNKTGSATDSKDSSYGNSIMKQMSDNKDMLLRTLYVTLGITGVIVVYFAARAIWLRQKRTKSRKYRIIAQNGDQKDLEMEPLGDGKDDDDEDYTVFEVNGRKK
jgi:hypothetical protein